MTMADSEIKISSGISRTLLGKAGPVPSNEEAKMAERLSIPKQEGDTKIKAAVQRQPLQVQAQPSAGKSSKPNSKFTALSTHLCPAWTGDFGVRDA